MKKEWGKYRAHSQDGRAAGLAQLLPDWRRLHHSLWKATPHQPTAFCTRSQLLHQQGVFQGAWFMQVLQVSHALTRRPHKWVFLSAADGINRGRLLPALDSTCCFPSMSARPKWQHTRAVVHGDFSLFPRRIWLPNLSFLLVPDIKITALQSNCIMVSSGGNQTVKWRFIEVSTRNTQRLSAYPYLYFGWSRSTQQPAGLRCVTKLASPSTLLSE